MKPPDRRRCVRTAHTLWQTCRFAHLPAVGIKLRRRALSQISLRTSHNLIAFAAYRLRDDSLFASLLSNRRDTANNKEPPASLTACGADRRRAASFRQRHALRGGSSVAPDSRHRRKLMVTVKVNGQ